MSLDSHFIPAFSIETVILDKDTGAPLSGGLVYFEQDNNRGVLKPVYQITGSSPNYTYTQLPNPMTLSAIGTFMDALDNPTVPYFFPYDDALDPEYYYVRVTSSTGVEQFTREAVPYLPNEGDISVSNAFSNELSNPQFSEILFDTGGTGHVFTIPSGADQMVQFAPDWYIVCSSGGGASVTLIQNIIAASASVPGNPGTSIKINSTGVGITDLRIRQRLYGAPALWGNGWISGTFAGKTYNGASTPVNMYYSQSNGVVTDQLISAGLLRADGQWDAFPDSIEIPTSGSTDVFPDAYIDIDLEIPSSTELELTSVMLAPTGDVSISGIVYEQESQNRQIDHLFHFYKPQLEYKPIPSMLTAWDFPTNPAQLWVTGNNITTDAATAQGAYIWDQTICGRAGSNVTVARNAITRGFQMTTTGATTGIYMLQYLAANEAREIIGNRLSVNLSAWRTSAGGTVTARVYLCRAPAATAFPTLPNIIGTVSTGGVFAPTAGNWALIPRTEYGTATCTLSTVTTNDQLNDVEDFMFNGWEITDAAQIADTDKFAIVVTFECPTSGTVITVDSISVCAGDIATVPAPQTLDEVLRECEYYYEQSWDSGLTAAAGAASPTNSLVFDQETAIVGVNRNAWPNGFSFPFRTIKRVAPTVTYYATGSATSGHVSCTIQSGGGGATSADDLVAPWTFVSGTKGVRAVPSAFGVLTAAVLIGGSTAFRSYITFHYSAEARLGVV